MRALWSDRPNCSHNVSQEVKRMRRFSDSKVRAIELMQTVLGHHPNSKRNADGVRSNLGALMVPIST